MKIDYKSGDIVGECTYIKDASPQFYNGNNIPRRTAQFKCKCGNLFTSVIDSVKRKATKSCGCLNTYTRVQTGKLKRTHGMSKTPLYNCWTRIKQRCTNENSQDYELYGGRGIKVCDNWMDSFEKFYDDMAPTYLKGLELERLDVNMDYSTTNCIWATEQVQAWNKRRSRNNTTGRSGVSLASRARKDGTIPYTASISKDGIEYYLGTFECFEDAVTAREAAELKFYGEIHPYK